MFDAARGPAGRYSRDVLPHCEILSTHSFPGLFLAMLLLCLHIVTMWLVHRWIQTRSVDACDKTSSYFNLESEVLSGLVGVRTAYSVLTTEILRPLQSSHFIFKSSFHSYLYPAPQIYGPARPLGHTVTFTPDMASLPDNKKDGIIWTCALLTDTFDLQTYLNSPQ